MENLGYQEKILSQNQFQSKFGWFFSDAKDRTIVLKGSRFKYHIFCTRINNILIIIIRFHVTT